MHSVNTWSASLNKIIFEGYPREFLIDKGKLPFSSWSDWGFYVLILLYQSQTKNYTIVLWDHEKCEKFGPKYESFEQMIYQLNKDNTQ
tara:strand:- start:33 stop:296 length:264 start_codon:yes stop_codon:yes gene_type:complete